MGAGRPRLRSDLVGCLQPSEVLPRRKELEVIRHDKKPELIKYRESCLTVRTVKTSKRQ